LTLLHFSVILAEIVSPELITNQLKKEECEMKRVIAVLFVLIAVGLVWFGCSKDNSVNAPVVQSQQAAKIVDLPDNLQKAAAALLAHNPHLLALSDVAGTAIGLEDDGTPVILILTRVPNARGIPAILDGVSVKVEVTGEIKALAQPEGKGNKPSPDAVLKPTSTWPRPVPIGVSTGNAGECSAGTISCRVIQGGKVYALSNNHVYALENSASMGSQVVQPGLYDTGCRFNSANVIGSLSSFVPIVFTTSANNTIDAAIALSSKANLGNTTPSGGYGTPNSITVMAVLGQSVQKYGRTTSLTKGTVTGINATINIGYSNGTARFVNQIIVQSKSAFIKAGDSGSLLVTSNTACNPVGLLFAGNGSGTLAVANQINNVLSALGVTIDGK
jgi:hypothetical protein